MTRPRGVSIRRWAVPLGLLLPLVAGLLLMLALGPRFRTLPGGVLVLEAAVMLFGVAIWRLRHPQLFGRSFLDRHPRFTVILAAVLGAASFLFGAPMAIDWTAQPDE